MARSRSVDLGFGGAIHVYDLDGQAYYMPGASHDAYLAAMAPDDDLQEVGQEEMEEALRVIVEIRMEKKHKEDEFQVIKVDEDQRIVYGWASVTTYKGEPVVDRQGDIIKTDTMHS